MGVSSVSVGPCLWSLGRGPPVARACRDAVSRCRRGDEVSGRRSAPRRMALPATRRAPGPSLGTRPVVGCFKLYQKIFLPLVRLPAEGDGEVRDDSMA